MSAPVVARTLPIVGLIMSAASTVAVAGNSRVDGFPLRTSAAFFKNATTVIDLGSGHVSGSTPNSPRICKFERPGSEDPVA